MTSRGPGVLIVSASAGTGHIRAGEALRESFATLGTHVEHVDILDLAPAWVRRAYGGGFELMVRRAPWMWAELYSRTDGVEPDAARWGPIAERLLFREFRRLAQSRNWGLVLCTHFLPCQLAAGRRDFPPFALAITDFDVHRYWVQSGVQRYFTASDSAAAALRARTTASVDCTGIPVHSAFGLARARSAADAAARNAAARVALGLNPLRPTALLMGGGFGFGVEEATESTLASGLDMLQLIVVCGRNEAALGRLAARDLPFHRVRLFGFVEDIHTFMSAADVVVTKPGGLTASESLAAGRPLLLTQPIPGHEAANLRVLTSLGAAHDASAADSLTTALRRVFLEPAKLLRMTTAARAFGRPDAASTIATIVMREYLLERAA